MNKRTRAIDEETYKLIISTIQKGFAYQGVMHKPNERIATVLQLEYNLGLRVCDILNLTMNSFVKDGGRYRLDIHEQKTGKYRNFTVPVAIYGFIRDYAYENNINPKARLFPTCPFMRSPAAMACSTRCSMTIAPYVTRMLIAICMYSVVRVKPSSSRMARNPLRS